ncbi:MAG: MBL fold metallo-hydrolase [Candidatus Atribacteria bacterium]|nr:MBL fold metallo-hydrolase [Candidatus Atribacteria bacterium]
MKIKWFGHSFFLVESFGGKKVAFDPYDYSVGYPLPDVIADMVCVSHHHHDHDNVSLVRWEPELIDEPGLYVREGLKITGFPTFHDREKGKKRGKNVVFRLEMENLSLIHAGDLGIIPEGSELSQWQPVDVLLVPVGGIYTLDGKEAKQLVDILQPKIVIPMHCKTPYLKFELHSAQEFASLFLRSEFLSTSQIEITLEHLPLSVEVWVLQPD